MVLFVKASSLLMILTQMKDDFVYEGIHLELLGSSPDGEGGMRRGKGTGTALPACPEGSMAALWP